MILNACIKNNKMVDEKICKECKEKCRHAGSPTTEDRLNYGMSKHVNGE
jgi:hypothetical protein